MSFGEQILATLIGSILGFGFAIVLFYVSEKIKARGQRKHLIRGLKKEFELNFLQIDKWIEITDEILLKIASNDHAISASYRLTDYQRLFTQLCFQQGILYNALEAKELATLNAILLDFDSGPTQWLNNFLMLWNQGKIDSAFGNQIFELERKTLKLHREQLETMLKSLKRQGSQR